MSSNKENANKEKPTKLFIERDVLGLEKTNGISNRSIPKPYRIFVVVAGLIIIAIVYWLYNH